jgi:2,4-dichlorophenol 6-monooxygenase
MTEEVPVLVVGGGGAGLTASMLLARMGVRSEVSARALIIWIDDEDGGRRPIKDLVRPGRFLLIAGEEGESWCEAARSIADAEGLPLDAVRIGHLDGELYDPRCTWLRHREIGPEGAILVRPDRFIAWRSLGAADASAEVLAQALGKILAAPIAAIAHA